MAGTTFINIDVEDGTAEGLINAHLTVSGGGASNWQHNADTLMPSMEWAGNLLHQQIRDMDPKVSMGQGKRLEMTPKAFCVGLAKWLDDDINRKALKSGEVLLVNEIPEVIPMSAIKAARKWYRQRYADSE